MTHEEWFAMKCKRCNEGFRPCEVRYRHEDNSYHQKCYTAQLAQEGKSHEAILAFACEEPPKAA